MVHVFDKSISPEDKLERKVQRSWAESVGGKLPHVTEDFYAKWDHSEVVSLIEGMEEAFPDRDTLRVDKAIEVIDRAASKIGEKIAATDIGTKLQQLNEDPSPENFAAFYEASIEAFQYVNNMQIFTHNLNLYHGHGVKAEDIQRLALHIGQSIGGVTELMNAVIPVIAQMPETDKKALLDADVIQPYRHLLESAVEVPLVADMSNHAALHQQLQTQIEAMQTIGKEVDDFKKSKQERQEAFGRMINQVIAQNATLANIRGYESRFGLAQATTGIRPTDREMIAAALEHKNGSDMNPVMPPRALMKMTSDNYDSFTYEEAVDIVINTLNKVHPELGAKFTECLEQNRAQIKKGFASEAYTIPAEYDHETGKMMPPRFVSSFDGSLLGVWMMAHEAAHVAHLALSAEQNGLGDYSPSVLVMEHFSHFIELMLRDELKARAENETDRAALDGFFQLHLTNGMQLQHSALFQADLHHQHEIEGKEITYDMVDAAYRKAGKQVFGDSWKGKESIVDDETFIGFIGNSQTMLPHQQSAYYGNYAASYALYEKRLEDPKAFGEKFVEAMKAGSRLNFERLMDHYFGEGQYQADNVYIKGIETWKDERSAAIDRMYAASKPDLTLKALTMDVGSLLRDLTVSRSLDAETTSRRKITELFIKYEPLVYHNRKAKKLFKKCEEIVKAWPSARDGLLIRQLHEMAEAVNPELGTSMKNLEQEELLEAFARGEVIEMDEHKYETPSEKAYEIAVGAIYDPETERVHYTAPDGEMYSSEASDYIIETDRGHESAEDIIKQKDKETGFASGIAKKIQAKRGSPDDEKDYRSM